MLVMTRRPGEKIVIDHTIEVAVLSVKGSQVRIGITAPKSMAVNRLEIEQMKESKAKQLIEDKT